MSKLRGADQSTYNVSGSAYIKAENSRKHLTLKPTFRQFVVTAVPIALVILGLLVFLQGFLLNRSEITTKSNAQSNNHAANGKLTLLVVDALAYKFVRRLPKIQALLNETVTASNGKLLPVGIFHKFLADPPTTTLQRLKGLLTGSMPTFIDAGSNFGSAELQEDNLLHQWFANALNVAFVGDDTWISLFPQGMNITVPYPSFNVRDLDTVDEGVKAFFHGEILASSGHSYDIVIGHMLGVDHCGHTWGPKHPEMQRKLDELDNFVDRIYRSLGDKDLFVVLGDHGMTATGDHGGDSVDELEAALLMFHKKGFPHAHNSKGKSEIPTTQSPMWQIDLVPILSAYTGVPVPFSNLGVINHQSLPGLIAERSSAFCKENVDQMREYVAAYESSFGKINLPQNIQKDMKYIPDKGETFCNERHHSAVERIRDIFRERWTRFDVMTISRGISIMAIGLVMCIISHQSFTQTILQLSVPYLISLSIFELLKLQILSLILLSLSIVYGVFLLVKKILKSNYFKIAENYDIIFAISILGPALTHFSNSFLIQELSVVVYVFQTLIASIGISTLMKMKKRSNLLSYIFAALVLTRVMLHFEVCREESPMHSNCYIAQKSAVDTSESTSDTYSQMFFNGGDTLFKCLLVLGLFGILPKTFLTMYGNITPYSSLFIKLTLKTLPVVSVVLLMISWFLEDFRKGLIIYKRYDMPGKNETVDVYKAYILHLLNTNLFNENHILFARMMIARAVMLTSFISLGCLCRSPRLLHIADTNSKMATKHDQTTVYGLATVYTSWLGVFLQNFIVMLLVGIGPSQLFGLFYVPVIIAFIACIIGHDHGPASSCLRHLLQQCSRWSVACACCLVSLIGFYATGHQTTLSHIPWDAVFTVHTGTSSIVPVVMVVMHMSASHLVTIASLPLLFTIPTHWRKEFVAREFTLCEESAGKLSVIAHLRQLYWRYLVCNTLFLFGATVSTGILRRHLMVWKIFAPNLLYVSIIYVVVCLFTFLMYQAFKCTVHRSLLEWKSSIAEKGE